MNSLVVILFGASFVISLVDVFAEWTMQDNSNIAQYYGSALKTYMRNEGVLDNTINEELTAIFAAGTIRSLSILKDVIEERLRKIKEKVEEHEYIGSMDHAMKITKGIAEICNFVNIYQKPEIRDPVIPGRDQLQAIYVAAAKYLLTHESLLDHASQDEPYSAPLLDTLNFHRVLFPNANKIPVEDINNEEYMTGIIAAFNGPNVCPQQ